MGLLLLYFPKVSLLNVRFFWVCPRSSSRDAEGMKRGENCVGIFVLSLIDRVHVNFGDGPFVTMSHLTFPTDAASRRTAAAISQSFATLR